MSLGISWRLPHWGYSIYALELCVNNVVNRCKQFSDIRVSAMGNPAIKHLAAIFTMGTIYFSGFGLVQASDAVSLKVSKKLSVRTNLFMTPAVAKLQGNDLLGKVPLFRGVPLNYKSPAPSDSDLSKTVSLESKEDRRSPIKAVYGGLQISLQENLSLVYAPGRLSGNTLNGESQGLYLLSDRGGLANWFMGIESRTYGGTADTRRTANTAQFGVIMDLD